MIPLSLKIALKVPSFTLISVDPLFRQKFPAHLYYPSFLLLFIALSNSLSCFILKGRFRLCGLAVLFLADLEPKLDGELSYSLLERMSWRVSEINFCSFYIKESSSSSWKTLGYENLLGRTMSSVWRMESTNRSESSGTLSREPLEMVRRDPIARKSRSLSMKCSSSNGSEAYSLS